MRLDVENTTQAASHSLRTGGQAENVVANSGNINDLLNAGIRYVQAGDRSEARVALLKVTELEPDNESAWLWLASISEYPEELLVFLNNVLAINPDNARASEWKASTNALLAKTFVQRGIDAAGANNAAFAAECLNRAIEFDPNNEMAWLWMASLAETAEGRLNFLEKVLKINPMNEAASKAFFKARKEITSEHLAAAKRAAVIGQKDEAYQLLRKVIEEDPACEEAWMLRSHFADNLDEKILSLQRVLEINPNNEAACVSIDSLSNIIGINVENPSDDRARPSFASEYHQAEGLHVEPEYDRIPTQDLEIPAEIIDEVRELESRATAEYIAETTDTFEEPAFIAENAEVTISEPEQIEVNEEAFGSIADEELVVDAGFYRTAEVTEDLDQEEDDTPVSAFPSPFESSAEVEISDGSYADTEYLERQADIAELAEHQPAEQASFADDIAEEPAVYISDEIAQYDPQSDTMASLDQEPFDESIEVSSSDVYESPAADTLELSADKVVEMVSETGLGEFHTDSNSNDAATEVPNIEADYSLEPPQVEEFGQYNDPTAKFEDSEPSFYTPFVSERIRIEAQSIPEMAEPVETVESVETFESDESDPFKTIPAVSFDELPEIATSETEAEPPPISDPIWNGHESHPVAPMAACAFCSNENDIGAISCNQCRAVLILSDLDLFSANPNLNQALVRSAVNKLEDERSNRVFTESELTMLAVGHLNLQDLQSGYHVLYEASKLNPGNFVLSSQVNSLLIRIEDVRKHEETAGSLTKNKTILVVDDSPTVRKLISGKLEKCGHEVYCCGDGVEALEMLGTLKPDMVLLDINMPKMDGYQTCKAIRSMPEIAKVPVVMISGKDGFFDKVRGKMAGTSAYITKPFGPETLMKTIESVFTATANGHEQMPADGELG